MIPGLRPANERRRYKVTPSLIGCAQTQNQPCIIVDLYKVYISACLSAASINRSTIVSVFKQSTEYTELLSCQLFGRLHVAWDIDIT